MISKTTTPRRAMLAAFAALFLAMLLIFANAALAADLNTIALNKALGLSVGRYVSFGSTTEGQASIAMRIRYIGTVGTPTIQVSAAGDLQFEQNGAVDTSVSSDGVIDLSTPSATEDTLGEVVGVINASPHWQAILVDALPSDKSDNVLATLTETGTGLTNPEGAPVFIDQSSIINGSEYGHTLSIGPEWTRDAAAPIGNLPSRQSAASASWRSELYTLTANSTFASGSSRLDVWAVKGSTEILLWRETGAATTVDKAKTFGGSNLVVPLVGPRGFRLVVRYVNTAAPTAGTLQVFGKTWQE